MPRPPPSPKEPGQAQEPHLHNRTSHRSLRLVCAFRVPRATGEAELGFRSCVGSFLQLLLPPWVQEAQTGEEGEESQDMSKKKVYSDPAAWTSALHAPRVPLAPQVLGEPSL